MKYCPSCGAALVVSAASFCPACGASLRSTPKKLPPKKRPPPQRSAAPAKRRKPPSDYDGYYRDTPTADGGHARDGIDPALVKRIALLAMGVVLVIVLAILAMYFL